MMEADDDIDSLSLDEDEESPKIEKKKKKKKKKKSRNNNKRRFSNEQVRSLETIFESETKLEPRKKVQVARELGLQPRQVAIWFQNKRARWKSKQIEKNYRVLKSNYDNLNARLESVRKDKEALLTQLQKLRCEVDKSNEGEQRHEPIPTNNQDIQTQHNNNSAPKQSTSPQDEIDHQAILYSDDDKSGGNIAYLGQEEPDLANMNENIDGSIISTAKWCNFDSGSLFDQSSSTSHWWESWT